MQRQVDSHVCYPSAASSRNESSTALRKKLFLNWHCSSQVVLYPEKVEVMVYQKMLRSLVGRVPRYIKLQTTSTAAPLMYIGGGKVLLLLKWLSPLFSWHWCRDPCTKSPAALFPVCDHNHHFWCCIPQLLCHLQYAICNISQYDWCDVLFSSHQVATCLILSWNFLCCQNSLDLSRHGLH